MPPSSLRRSKRAAPRWLMTPTTPKRARRHCRCYRCSCYRCPLLPSQGTGRRRRGGAARRRARRCRAGAAIFFLREKKEVEKEHEAEDAFDQAGSPPSDFRSISFSLSSFLSPGPLENKKRGSKPTALTGGPNAYESKALPWSGPSWLAASLMALKIPPPPTCASSSALFSSLAVAAAARDG